MSRVVSKTLSATPGITHTLGATLVDGGVNFAIFSRHASSLDLCLYDADQPERETHRIKMHRGEADLWHVRVHGIGPGTLYGFRAHGAWLPVNGLRFNAHKLLLDPYAKAIAGLPECRDDMLTEQDPTLGHGSLDNGATALKSVVVSDDFDWQGDVSPEVPWEQTMLYELHVKGFTRLFPGVPEKLRGTYAGLGHPAVTAHLKRIGVTSVQLLPVHQHLDDEFLVKKGLTNYWGYNTIGFFAAHSEYAAASDPQEQIREFKGMVKALHEAGLEVILDVVYNHTAEGDERGPSLLFRGLDNLTYYRHEFDGEKMFYSNITGCGNSVASNNGAPLRLILDSLRYWVTEMHVDGFRFDLAVTVARDREHFHVLSPFFNAVQQDPVLSRVKLIAEPWDLGREDSYQVGQFPAPWRELNGKYRDTVRRFWRGDAGVMAEFAKRLCGSEDIYGWNRRPPLASVNMITSHDGFTLHDLFAYSQKHNEANGEENRDGDNVSHSTNCGVEGETTDAEILALRLRLAKNMLATMMCSLGVPFLTAGDERGRTQKGNNNAYCQDNDLNWLDWAGGDLALEDFVRRLIDFRRVRPALGRAFHFDGKVNPDTNRPDITWLNGKGEKLTWDEWHDPEHRYFAGLYDEPENRCAPVNGRGEDHRPFLLIFNGGEEEQQMTLPVEAGHVWELAFDTALATSFPENPLIHQGGAVLPVMPRSVACLVLSKA